MIVRNPSRRPTSRRAFTLTEMLVVVAIIVLLASISVPIGIGLYEGAKRSSALAVVKGPLSTAVANYRTRHDDLPQTLDDVFLDTQLGLDASQRNDPWGQPYEYSRESSHGMQYGDIWSTCGGQADENNWAGNWMQK
jgi:prepilin-type N-terminal cleavage/methylation domain-containing protein